MEINKNKKKAKELNIPRQNVMSRKDFKKKLPKTPLSRRLSLV